MIRADEVYTRGDTLEEAKYKITKHVVESFGYLSQTRAMEEAGRELCIDPKTVKRILERTGGEYEEVITKIPTDRPAKTRQKPSSGN